MGEVRCAPASVRNIRDLGGLKTRDGKRIRTGCLVRSAHLGALTGEDLELLRGPWRVRTVIDLRTPAERLECPDRVRGVSYLALPVIEDMAAGISHEKAADDLPIPDMRILYRKMMTTPECVRGFQRILNAILCSDLSCGAVLWHCTEGKDRCGMVTALVLEMLGVDRQTILADYLKTNETALPRAQAMYEQARQAYGERAAQRIREAYIVKEDYLRAAWDAMGEGYAERVLEIPQEAQETFRRAVLEEDP